MILTFDKVATDHVTALSLVAGMPIPEVIRHALTLYQLALHEREGNKLMVGSIEVDLAPARVFP